MYKRVSILLFLLASVAPIVEAQETFQPRPLSLSNNAGIIYDSEFTVDVRLHTNGFALAFSKGKIKTYYKTNYWQGELGELKHQKEYRNTFDFARNGNNGSFIYGKRNNLYALRFALGQKRYLSEKAKKKGLAVGFTYAAGPSLGILKPYQLRLINFNDPTNPTDDFENNESYSEENKEIFTDINHIAGAAGIGKGWREAKLRPGLHTKASLHLDWGAFDEMVKAFEVGIMFDVYTQKIPLLIPAEGNENKPYFLNLYLTLQFGKRW